MSKMEIKVGNPSVAPGHLNPLCQMGFRSKKVTGPQLRGRLGTCKAREIMRIMMSKVMK